MDQDRPDRQFDGVSEQEVPRPIRLNVLPRDQQGERRQARCCAKDGRE
jgi:hypothetical protein